MLFFIPMFILDRDLHGRPRGASSLTNIPMDLLFIYYNVAYLDL